MLKDETLAASICHEAGGRFMSNAQDPEDDLANLLDRARAGCNDAMWQVMRLFSPSVYRSIRQALSRPVRRLNDSDDVAQSVWNSFFAKSESFFHKASPGQIRAFLKTIAKNKTIDRGRRFFKEQRRFEQCVAGMQAAIKPEYPANKRTPTPSEEMIAQESLERLTQGVPEEYQDMIRKRAEGASVDEIASELGISSRSFHRIIRDVRDRFQE